MSEARRRLAELRKAIYASDRKILDELEERARFSGEIRTLIEEQGPGAPVDERAWLQDLLSASGGSWPEQSLQRIFRAIRGEARGLESAARIAYAGAEGGFAHLAASGYFGAAAQYSGCMSASGALSGVERGEADYAVFPFENTAEGLIQPSVGALLDSSLSIVGEILEDAHFGLFSGTGNAADIDKIFLTGDGQPHCAATLERDYPRASVIDVRSAELAVEFATEDHAGAAAVPVGTGSKSGLRLVNRNIGIEPDLRIRFCVAGSRPAPRSGHDSTCLVFSAGERAGELFDVLRHFSDQEVSLKRLHSRPVRGSSWEYLFYAEVSGHASDRALVTALEAVKRDTPYAKVLGSFPVAD